MAHRLVLPGTLILIVPELGHGYNNDERTTARVGLSCMSLGASIWYREAARGPLQRCAVRHLGGSKVVIHKSSSIPYAVIASLPPICDVYVWLDLQFKRMKFHKLKYWQHLQ